MDSWPYAYVDSFGMATDFAQFNAQFARGNAPVPLVGTPAQEIVPLLEGQSAAALRPPCVISSCAVPPGAHCRDQSCPPFHDLQGKACVELSVKGGQELLTRSEPLMRRA